jgi:quercetin dioxygenase-like cupin family protein
MIEVKLGTPGSVRAAGLNRVCIASSEKLREACDRIVVREQSFGLVHIVPGKTNPEHWHTAAQDIVFMLQGQYDVHLGKRDLKVGPGQMLYIPEGVKHEVVNRGCERVVYVCSFSASMRGTLFQDPLAPGVRPLSGKSGTQPW